MNEYLQKFRAQHPDYDDMSDDDLAKALHAKFYADMPFAEFAQRIGSSTPTPADNPAGDDGWRDVPPPASTAPQSLDSFGSGEGVSGSGGGAFGSTDIGRSQGSPREAGREFAGKQNSQFAAIQGVGMGVTPVTAAAKYVSSRVGDDEPRTWNESMEFARGAREGAYEKYPAAHIGGSVLGAVGGVKAGAALVSKLPAVPAAVKSVFTLQKGQTARNIARMAATSPAAKSAVLGAASAGAAAGLQGDDVASAAKVGGVVGGAVGGVVSAVRFLSPDAAAVRMLAKRWKEPAAAIAARYNRVAEQLGRKPSLLEIAPKETAESLSQIGAAKPAAARVFGEAEERFSGALPGEMRAFVKQGGATTTVPAEEAALEKVAGVVGRTAPMIRTGGTSVASAEANLATTAEEGRRAADAVRAAGGTTVAAEEARLAVLTEATRKTAGAEVRRSVKDQLVDRDDAMDAVMGTIGNHSVHLSDDIVRTLKSQEVQGTLSKANRTELNDLLDTAEESGMFAIPLRMMETVRKRLSDAAKREVGSTFSELRSEVSGHAATRVPAYGEALKEYGLRSATAEATQKVRQAVLGDARDFAALLRRAGGGSAVDPKRPDVRAAWKTGGQQGVRLWLSKQLNGSPQEAERVMKNIARNTRLRENIREALSPAEVRQLEGLGDAFGQQLKIVGEARAANVVRGRVAERVINSMGRVEGTLGRESVQKALTSEETAQLSGLVGKYKSQLGAVKAAKVSEQVRERLANQMLNSPQAALNSLVRTDVKRALTPEELTSLNVLNDMLEHQTNTVKNAKIGARVLAGKDSDTFADAVTNARAVPGAVDVVERSSRGTLANAFGESPVSAEAGAYALAKNPGLQDRIATAFGVPEAVRLQEIGTSVTKGARNYAIATRTTEAQSERLAQSRLLQDVIGAGVIAGGRFSGAMLANNASSWYRRWSLRGGTAKKLAEMATDPEKAHIFIDRMMKRGATPDEILGWYQTAAVAAGITTGGALSGN